MLRATILWVKEVDLLKMQMLINEQTLSSIMGKMPVVDWKQWVMKRPLWVKYKIEMAFGRFIEQKRRDGLDMAVTKPAG